MEIKEHLASDHGTCGIRMYWNDGIIYKETHFGIIGCGHEYWGILYYGAVFGTRTPSLPIVFVVLRIYFWAVQFLLGKGKTVFEKNYRAEILGKKAVVIWGLHFYGIE